MNINFGTKINLFWAKKVLIINHLFFPNINKLSALNEKEMVCWWKTL